MLLIAITIILYSKYRCNNEKFVDPLTTGNKICSICDGWSILHFTLFMICGYLFPKEFIFTTLCGILWELLEYLVSNTEYSIFDVLRGISQCKLTDNDTIGEHWFYSKYTDIILNILGFIVGSFISIGKFSIY